MTSILLVCLALGYSQSAENASLDIEKASCEHEDFRELGFELFRSERPTAESEDEVQERYRTDWSSSGGNRIRCLTYVYSSIEDARWALQYSTAVQRRWDQEEERARRELLKHRQVVVPAIGEDTLGIEIEAGRQIEVQGKKVPLEEYVATIVLFRRANIVVSVEYAWVLGSAFQNYAVEAFFRESPRNEPIKLARLVDDRLRVQLDGDKH